MEIPKAQEAYDRAVANFDEIDIEKEKSALGEEIEKMIGLGYLMAYSDRILDIRVANKLVAYLDQLGYNSGMTAGQPMINEKQERIPNWFVYANWEMMPVNRRERVL